MGLWPGPAQSETIRIRSGEHGAFSRLVLPLAEPTRWRFGRILDGYRLQLQRGDVEFDLAAVFDKIPRKRLRAVAVTPDGRGLSLRLGCDCYAEIFEFRRTSLVIDIRDGAPPDNAPFETAFDAQIAAAVSPETGTEDETPTAAPSAPVAIYDWRANLPALPELPAPAVEESRSEKATTTADAPEPQAEAPAPPPETAARRAQLAAAQTRLIHELSRAATQGLIVADPHAFKIAKEAAAADAAASSAGVSEPERDEIRRDAAPEISPAAEPEPKPPANTAQRQIRLGHAVDANRRLEAATAFDLAMEGAGAQAQDADSCLPDDMVAIENWGTEAAPARQIQALRQGLIGEFDRPAQDRVRDLARLYIYLGFGVETRALLREMRAGLAETDVLSAMAQVMDDGAARRPGRLTATQMRCDGKVALWAVLAQDRLRPDAEIETGAVIRAFAALPPRLRHLLGPGLAGKFLEAGDSEAVRAVRGAMARAAGDPGPEARLLAARLDLARGRSDRAERVIAEIAQSRDPAAHEALILLVEERVQRGLGVESSTLTLIDALARPAHGSDVGFRLARAAALARAANGAFDAAFAEMDALGAELDRPGLGESGKRQRRELRDAAARRIWDLFAARGADRAVLDHALTPPPPGQADPAVRAILADRLLTLGFPAAAEAWLGDGTQADPDQRRLRARARLAQGDAAGALAVLGALGDVAAEQLRGAALAAQGDHLAAAEAFARADAPGRQALEAWRGADFSQAARLAPPERRRAIELLAETPKPAAERAAAQGDRSAPAPGSLAQGQALVQDSRDIQAALDLLLPAQSGDPASTPPDR